MVLAVIIVMLAKVHQRRRKSKTVHFTVLNNFFSLVIWDLPRALVFLLLSFLLIFFRLYILWLLLKIGYVHKLVSNRNIKMAFFKLLWWKWTGVVLTVRFIKVCRVWHRQASFLEAFTSLFDRIPGTCWIGCLLAGDSFWWRLTLISL